MRSGIQRKLLNRQSVISSEVLNEFEELSWEPEKIIAYNYRGMRQEPENANVGNTTWRTPEENGYSVIFLLQNPNCQKQPAKNGKSLYDRHYAGAF